MKDFRVLVHYRGEAVCSFRVSGGRLSGVANDILQTVSPTDLFIRNEVEGITYPYDKARRLWCDEETGYWMTYSWEETELLDFLPDVEFISMKEILEQTGIDEHMVRFVGSTLRDLGWVRRRKLIDGKVRRVWFPPEDKGE